MGQHSIPRSLGTLLCIGVGTPDDGSLRASRDFRPVYVAQLDDLRRLPVPEDAHAVLWLDGLTPMEARSVLDYTRKRMRPGLLRFGGLPSSAAKLLAVHKHATGWRI